MATYWCHRCRRTIESSNLKCPICDDEFLEEVRQPHAIENPFAAFMAGGSSGVPQAAGDQVPEGSQENPVFPGHSRSFQFSNGGSGVRFVFSSENGEPIPNFPLPAFLQQVIDSHNDIPQFNQQNPQNPPLNQQGPNQNQNPNGPGVIGNFLNHLLANLAGGQGGGGAGGGGAGGRGGGGGEGPSVRFMFNGQGPDGEHIRGNLGNYVFGEQNFENLITSLLNNFEQSQGLRKEDAKRVPETKVTQKHVDNGAQCTTCMDIFVLDETVCQLNCSHIFHKQCIVPWLERQKTCPICRQEVDPNVWPGAAPPRLITDVDELD